MSYNKSFCCRASRVLTLAHRQKLEKVTDDANSLIISVFGKLGHFKLEVTKKIIFCRTD